MGNSEANPIGARRAKEITVISFIRMAENTDTKIPYIPSQTKRFEISKDSFSKERVTAVHEAYKQLKQEVPFFAGITVFGSLSKGKALTKQTADKSDVDFVVFLDRDEYEKTIEKFARITSGFVPMQRLYSSDKEKVRQDGLQNGAMEYVFYRARDIIKANIVNLAQGAKKKFAGNLASFISLEGNESIFNLVDLHDWFVEQTGYDGEENLWDYAAPFFLDVGGGLKKYRRAFIKRLSEEPTDRAEYLWSIVVKAMKYWERKEEVPEEISRSYPTTFEDAKKYYGLPPDSSV